jgi:hypothetical protein
MMTNDLTLAARYQRLIERRRPFLERARECARYTLPFLMPPEGHSRDTHFKTPWQGVGARGVNNLASKLLLALLPPNSPFFRLVIHDGALERIIEEEGLKADIDATLGQIERLIMTEIETSALRVGVFEALKHLIVTGNSLLYLSPTQGLRVFHLDCYAVRRDPVGHVLEIMTLEKIDPRLLPQEVRSAAPSESKEPLSDEKPLDLYTRIVLKENQWQVSQEANKIKLPDSYGLYPLDRSPWIPLRFIRVDNEDYGRGFVEEYLGDLKSLEVLTQAIVEGSAASAKVLFLVKPNSTTHEKTLAEAPNGAIRSGSADDVSVLQVQKHADFAVAKNTMDDITQRLSFAFLLNSSIQRKGERVTAEEIRHMAGELEDALGGVYSILSQEFQLPLIHRLMYQMEKAGMLPQLPKGIIKPMIITGLEALGRGHDLTKLESFVDDLTRLGQAMPEILMRLNASDLIQRLATARGIETHGLIKSDEQILAEQQQQAAQQLMQGAAL